MFHSYAPFEPRAAVPALAENFMITRRTSPSSAERPRNHSGAEQGDETAAGTNEAIEEIALKPEEMTPARLIRKIDRLIARHDVVSALDLALRALACGDVKGKAYEDVLSLAEEGLEYLRIHGQTALSRAFEWQLSAFAPRLQSGLETPAGDFSRKNLPPAQLELKPAA